MNLLKCSRIFSIKKTFFGFIIITQCVHYNVCNSYSAETPRLNSDPKSITMGSNVVAHKSRLPAAVFSNPAALVGVNSPYLSFNNLILPENQRYISASFGTPTSYGNIGVSMFNMGYGDFSGYDNDFNQIDVGATGDSGFMLSYAASVVDNVPVRKEYGVVGMNLKFLHSSLGGYSAESVIMDIGCIYNIPFAKNTTLGLVYKNLGSSMKYVAQDTETPTELNVGIGYKNETLSDLSVEIGYYMPKNETTSYSIGVGFSPVYFMNLRAGWRQVHESLTSNLRFGFGLDFGGFDFDYAFIPFEEFGYINAVSIGMAIGNVVKLETASDYYLNKHFREAVESYYRRDYISARRQFEDILSTYPDHDPSHRYLIKIISALETRDEIKEKNINKLLQKADAALEKKDHVKATKFYNKVLYLDSTDEFAKDGLKNVNNVVRNIKQEKKVRKNIDLIRATWKRALHLYRKGDLVRSKEEFRNVLKIDPGNKKAKERIMEIDEQLSRIAAGKVNQLYDKGVDLYRSGKYEEAIKYFEAVVIASPNRFDAKDLIKRAKRNMSDIDARAKAERLAVEQEKMKGEMARVFESALNYYEKSNYEEALDKFQISEELAVTYEFDSYYIEIKNYLTIVRQALTDKHYKKGTEYFRNNRLEAAVAEYRKALDYNPENTSAKVDLDRVSKELSQRYYEQGMAYFARSDLRKAKQMFKKSLFYEADKIESKRALQRIN